MAAFGDRPEWLANSLGAYNAGLTNADLNVYRQWDATAYGSASTTIVSAPLVVKTVGFVGDDKTPSQHPDLAWLDRRVEEMRVKL